MAAMMSDLQGRLNVRVEYAAAASYAEMTARIKAGQYKTMQEASDALKQAWQNVIFSPNAPARNFPIDLSTPSAAMRTFAVALERDNRTIALIASTPDMRNRDPRTTSFVEAMVDRDACERQMVDAAIERFGDKARDQFRTPMSQTLLKAASLPPAIDGKTATIPFDKKPIRLKKNADGWTLDWIATIEGPPTDEQLRVMRAIVASVAEVTGNIKAGQYSTAQEAGQAINEKLFAITSTVSPATAPAH
jgi:hypothetical protein